MICSPATVGRGGGCSRIVNPIRATTFAFFLTGLISIQAATPFKKTSGGGLLHAPSNVLFPSKVELFQRADSYTQIYGSQGRDVSVRYLLDALIICEVYVYPVGTYGTDLKSEFRIQQRAITQINKQVKLLSQDSAHTNQRGQSMGGLHANYELTRHLFSGKDQRCGSQLFVFRNGAWFVAYRFSYPREHPDIANKHVSDFLRGWDWKNYEET